MKNGMMSVVCRKPGELALEERPLPERQRGRGAARHPPHRHLRHRLSHLRGAASLPAVPAHHGPRALRRGAGSAEGQQIRGGRSGHRHPLSLLRDLRRLQARQDELLHDAAMPRRPLRRRHDRALSSAGEEPLPGRRAFARPGGDGRIPRHRRACGAPLAAHPRRPGACRRRRPDRHRHGALRAASPERR